MGENTFQLEKFCHCRKTFFDVFILNSILVETILVDANYCSYAKNVTLCVKFQTEVANQVIEKIPKNSLEVFYLK